MTFANIIDLYYNSANYHVDAVAQSPYLSFSTPTGPAGCTFISYEDENSVAQKADYLRANGLGGALIWQLNEGYNPNWIHPNRLLSAVGAAFLGGTSGPWTTTSVAVSASPGVAGQMVTLTAVVGGSDGSTPTGTVTFIDGATTLGRATLNGDFASLSIATLAVGSHNVTAVYSGSAGYKTSTSLPVTVTVNKASTTTNVASSKNGRKVTLTATVSVVAPGAGTPAGPVVFFDDGMQIGSASLSGGKAAFTTAWWASGKHAITASYAGSANYLGSTSAVSVVVN
jgi:hypothetical protein